VARLLARTARWSLPVALIVAALVAVGGLGTMLFAPNAGPPAAPAALDLNDPTAGGTTLVPQGAPGAQPGCPATVPTPCPAGASGRAGANRAAPGSSAPSGCCR
jgi:hypothetical protein